MGILILKVLASWSLLAMAAGLVLDEFLSCVFATVETLQAYRS
jgi:hypothetical protein